MTWFPLFLQLFALGMAGALVAVPYRQIGKYFFTFHAILLLVLVSLAVAIGQPWKAISAGTALARFVAGVGLLFSALILVENFIIRSAGSELRIDGLLLPVSVGVIYIAFEAFARTKYGTGWATLLTAHFLTSAAVLGTSMLAMSAGHWYLSNAKLPFEILIRLCRMFAVALGAKALVSAVYVVARFDDYQRLEAFDQLAMVTRVAAGLVLASVLAFMSLSCAKRKANQSATGILYVAVVFVLIGETISMYLTLGQGRPI